MDDGNGLVLADTEDGEGHDELLSSLSELAFSSPAGDDGIIVEDARNSKYRSRFFFRITASFDDEVKKLRKNTNVKHKTGRQHVDDEVMARLADYKGTAPKAIAEQLKTVREFFLSEVGIKTLAGDAGANQARDVVQRMLGSPVDGTQFAKFERMSHEAVSIKMARFIAKFYGLRVADIERVLAASSPRQQPFAIPIANPAAPPPAAAQPYESRREKAKRRKQSTQES